ncbi:adenine phosphoribosyltransferase isoform X2 [Monomorium pharaonis]|uniref:adenine phosphoribosyltransferase isoform X2 n=1 Tax=Monomorium pharaonis TaxID=307658 RepID=UPI00063FCE58|nr:adenine phosphoribosyltransferase isoform X2 [Monomorium pharaonis]
MDKNDKLRILKNAIKSYPDFPEPGIIFRDIFEVDLVVGLDSRGFLFGPMICMELGKPFLPIRKKGKLPGKVIQQKYTLEYGEAIFELQTEFIKKGIRALIVDDLLATGGSMATAVKLLKSAGADVIECLVIMELTSLKGRDKLGVPVHSFIQYDH